MSNYRGAGSSMPLPMRSRNHSCSIAAIAGRSCWVCRRRRLTYLAWVETVGGFASKSKFRSVSAANLIRSLPYRDTKAAECLNIQRSAGFNRNTRKACIGHRGRKVSVAVMSHMLHYMAPSFSTRWESRCSMRLVTFSLLYNLQLQLNRCMRRFVYAPPLGPDEIASGDDANDFSGCGAPRYR